MASEKDEHQRNELATTTVGPPRSSTSSSDSSSSSVVMTTVIVVIQLYTRGWRVINCIILFSMCNTQLCMVYFMFIVHILMCKRHRAWCRRPPYGRMKGVKKKGPGVCRIFSSSCVFVCVRLYMYR